ncbi:Transmembrane amino acid transporter family protein isoform 2 [Hibiscus syriacus]|uniref:Transmembrane amino acid transporter family protein isoform 2 n=1 Tax=Hibiscus syriacus TaxID=106335 RepID=A0A6A3AME9_HIBSY|nr:Transmembrane amino acid transporter family protein isoform 2 [Hibiscus syriacus]
MSSHQVELPPISGNRTTMESKFDVHVEDEDSKDHEHEVSGKGAGNTQPFMFPQPLLPLPLMLLFLSPSLLSVGLSVSGVTILLHFFSKWLRSETISPFKSPPAAASRLAVYKHYHKHDSLTLQHFIIFFGGFELFLSQLPDIHSLRWVNGLCTFSTIGFAGSTIGVTIYNGKSIYRESISYSLQGSSSAKRFAAFNALGAISFSFGDAMLPEIQNTVREPAVKNMYKGVSAAYSVIVSTYWQIACIGYWAFGSQVQPYIVASLTVPKWTFVMANIFAVIQISGCHQIYCRPTYAYFEERLLSRTTNSSASVFGNRLLRLTFTSIYIVVVTLVASAMPFFVRS